MNRILFIFGTRPEAIKLCPLIRRLLASSGEFEARVCVTAQHRDMLDQVLGVFSVTPDHDLNVMCSGQTLPSLTARILMSVEPVLEAEHPDLVVVQGDTTTTMAASLAAFYCRLPLAHIEAGLRTGDIGQPFPEEMNRLLTSRLATLHFAPTARASQALEREGVNPGKIHVTGNTGIDALLYVRDQLECGAVEAPVWPWLDSTRRLILVTSHRRESFGPAFERVLRSLARLGARPDVQVVFPVHRNPQVADAAYRTLSGLPNVVLIDPLPYLPFVDLMRRCRIIITDSGGIQEEAPSLGKPVLVLREKTERPEAVEAGTVKLVGTNEESILRETARLLEDEDAYLGMTRVHNPYGDGRACERIADILSHRSVSDEPAKSSTD